MPRAKPKGFLRDPVAPAPKVGERGLGIVDGALAFAQSQASQIENQARAALTRARNSFGAALSGTSVVEPRSSKASLGEARTKPGQQVLRETTSRMDRARNVATNQSGPSPSMQPGRPVLRPGANAGLLSGNPLNDYIDVQYHVVLSVVPESATKKVQPDIISQRTGCASYFDEMQRSVRRDGSVTLAATGETFRNSTSLVDLTRTQKRPVAPTEEQRTRSQQRVVGLQKQISGKQEELRNFLGRNAEENANLSRARVLRAEINRLERMLAGATAGSPVMQTPEEPLTPVEADVSQRRYYNIKGFTLTNIMAPTSQNPLFSSLVSAQMQLAEPLGFSLHDDIRMLAKKLGYEGVHYHRMTYRLDVFFSGYDPDTGAYVPLIPIAIKQSEESGCSGVVSYYLVITNMTAKTTHTGTEYTIDLAPTGALALRPEDSVIEGTNIEIGKDPTFGEFLKKLSTALGKAKRAQTKDGAAPQGTGSTRIYEFIAPEDLVQSRFNYLQSKAIAAEHDATENPEDGTKMHFHQSDSVLNIIKKALDALPDVHDRWLANGPGNEDFSQPRLRYAVRLNTIYGEKNPQINDYRTIRYQYIIEPHYTYKDFEIVSREQALTALSLQARLRRLKEMIRLGMVQRKYSYLFTSENTEVIDLDLHFSMFYFSPLAQDDTNTRAYSLAASRTTPAADNDDLNRTIANPESAEKKPLTGVAAAIRDSSLRTRLESNVNTTLKRLFGVVPSGEIRNNAVGLEIPNVALITTPSDARTEGGSRADAAGQKQNQYLRSIKNNLEQDLLEIDMKVRGDPIYFFSPYGTQSLNILDPLKAIRYTNIDVEANKDVSKQAVQPSTDKVFFLNVSIPDQSEYLNPESNEITSRNSIIGGFYMIVEVKSEFNGGNFTQTIKAVKIPNLNYLAEYIGLFEPTPVAGTEDKQINDRIVDTESGQ